ncbi:MAG TPA: hypothetical protein VI248_05550 [Kineosporiaceae bacterium]
MCGAVGSRPRPFAIGVLAVDDGGKGGTPSEGRLDIALDAYKYGYFLLDTIETSPPGTGYLAVELLVSRSGADALVVRGCVDEGWLCAVADRHRLVVRRSRG